MSKQAGSPGNWIAVASADHVRVGWRDGFMQAGHGKAAPLRRIAAGDRVVYYSPATTLGGKDRLQSFTAIGVVKDRAPYQAKMGRSFHPFRRDVAWLKSRDAAIQPLLEQLEFTAGKTSWDTSSGSVCFRSARPTWMSSRAR
jgi:EVE domain